MRCYFSYPSRPISNSKSNDSQRLLSTPTVPMTHNTNFYPSACLSSRLIYLCGANYGVYHVDTKQAVIFVFELRMKSDAFPLLLSKIRRWICLQCLFTTHLLTGFRQMRKIALYSRIRFQQRFFVGPGRIFSFITAVLKLSLSPGHLRSLTGEYLTWVAQYHGKAT